MIYYLDPFQLNLMNISFLLSEWVKSTQQFHIYNNEFQFSADCIEKFGIKANFINKNETFYGHFTTKLRWID